ncbi:oligosaccharide flippase family protein [Morganella morganii]|nr:oligosaccharide flippase family protein [Morganella morganii]
MSLIFNLPILLCVIIYLSANYYPMAHLLKNTFLKQSSIYLFSNILNALIPFILLPFFSQYLDTEAYGKIAIFQLIITGLGAIIGLNTVGAASRYYFEKSSFRQKILYNNSGFSILIYSTIFILITSLIFSHSLTYFFNIPTHWIILAIVNSFGLFIIQFRLTYFQIKNNALKYSIYQVGNSIVNFILTIILISKFNLGEDGRVYSILISTFLFSALSLISLFRENLISFLYKKHKYIKNNLSFGLPLLPHVFGVFLLSSIDRFYISKYFDLSTAGIYMMAFQVSMGLLLVFDAMNKAFTPFLFRTLSSITEKDKNKIVKISYFLFIFCIVIGFISYLVSPILLVFFIGEKYVKSSQIVNLLCIGQTFQGLYLVITNYIFYAKKTLYLSFVTIFSGFFNMILLVMLVPEYGLIGASISFCISMAIRFIFTWFVSYKVYPMPWFSFLKKKNR